MSGTTAGAPRDYLADHGAVLHAEGSGTKLRFGSRSYLLRATPDVIRGAVNAAVQALAPRYAERIARAGAGALVPPRAAEGAALAVALDHVYGIVLHSSRWSRDRALAQWFTRWPLAVERDELLFYCERMFGAGYQPAAAALAGVPLAEFAEWERARREFWDRF